MGANSSLYEMTPIYMEGNNENDRVTAPENVLIHLKFFSLELGQTVQMLEICKERQI